ncbi:tRNA adenosine(34) deaminase TadA [Marinimicrobium sp. C6131]|uniref:tRNA adenosine(34) deaminase TadA n=1 Tax=Marinimicrobium sp. C6131 TaxID=3022676 RepID=UPI00223DF57D|nr:tRNA adenosine(34) deaminase TadA [Marinimicrobium sp. C6131]UZJ45814.1 tRNA adenosine(34) deaminase TadA [Marinimicrobium sp. C6131]
MGGTVATDTVHERDEYWMRRALSLAEQGARLGEVPVGAILVRDDSVLGEGFNQPIRAQDPTAHAEVVALRQAATLEQNYRLPDTTLYVTLEPCTMCIGALIHARVARLVYGTTEPKAGVVESRNQLAQTDYYNHWLAVQGGVLADACQQQLTEFFRRRRAEAKARKQTQNPS